jgi:hypothetical protein
MAVVAALSWGCSTRKMTYCNTLDPLLVPTGNSSRYQ